MDREQLQSSLPDAFTDVRKQREYFAEIKALRDGPVAELQQRLDAVLGAFKQISQIFYGYSFGGAIICVDRVGAESEKGEIPGKIFANIQNLSRDHSVSAGYSDNTVTQAQMSHPAFLLTYSFTPTEEQGHEKTHISTESTVAPPIEGFDEPGIDRHWALPVDRYIRHDQEGALEYLETYKTVYLPARTQQVSELEASVELLKNAISNPELNPDFARMVGASYADAEIEDAERLSYIAGVEQQNQANEEAPKPRRIFGGGKTKASVN